MAKLESQSRLVNALKTFTGARPACYASEKEFFLVSLQDMAEYLEDLQRETLKEICGSFIRKLDAGKVPPPVIEEFKAALDRLILNDDFKKVCAGMVGSKDFIKQRLDGLRAVSLLGEAKKTSGRDPEAERNINSTYNRLNFDALVRRVEAAPGDITADTVLAKAREEVAGYCSLYRVQLNEADTLTPFSLSCVDAALAASYRLFRNVGRASGRSI